MVRGGAFFRRKAGRRDENHAAIRDGLRKLGHLVVDLAGVGDGVADLLVFPRGEWAGCVFVEVKTEDGERNAAQIRFAAAMRPRGIRVAVARTLHDALIAIQAPARSGRRRNRGGE